MLFDVIADVVWELNRISDTVLVFTVETVYIAITALSYCNSEFYSRSLSHLQTPVLCRYFSERPLAQPGPIVPIRATAASTRMLQPGAQPWSPGGQAPGRSHTVMVRSSWAPAAPRRVTWFCCSGTQLVWFIGRPVVGVWPQAQTGWLWRITGSWAGLHRPSLKKKFGIGVVLRNKP